MDFDTSDVSEVVWRHSRPGTEPIPIDEEDMLEAACLLPERTAPSEPDGQPGAVPTPIRDELEAT